MHGHNVISHRFKSMPAPGNKLIECRTCDKELAGLKVGYLMLIPIETYSTCDFNPPVPPPPVVLPMEGQISIMTFGGYTASIAKLV